MDSRSPPIRLAESFGLLLASFAVTDPENEPDPTSAVDIRSASESPVHNQVEYELYRRACAAMVDQRAPRQRAEDTVLLLGTMVLFALAVWWQFGFHTIALTQVVPILVGVILLHEFGH